jgi:SprT protein
MPKQQVSFAALIPYLPDGSFESVLHYIQLYRVQLTVTRQRQTILGDYRHAYNSIGHRISINGNLNKYSFLITLLHELAHLFTYERYSHRVKSHGKEWKTEFSKILAEFLAKKIFPADIEATLLATLKNSPASSCGDEKLLRALKNYDPPKPGHYFIEQIPVGTKFKIKGDRIFIKGEKIRTRYKCQEVSTGKWYLFSGVYEAESL